MTIEAGAPAPDFTLQSDEGGSITLSEMRGKSVVLYFYPKDDTPGCTTEAQSFSALADDFAAANAVVVGVSRDSLKRHVNFRRKYDLKVRLGADSGEVTEAYGVWVEKSLYGRQYMGIERATFLIDGSGVVRRVWRKVKVTGHAAEVLKAVQELN